MGAYSEIVPFFDLLYSSLKDYEHEARKIDEVLRGSGQTARRILDVGCGTGLHAYALARLGYVVDGVDVEPGCLRIAADRNPQGVFRRADMRTLAVDDPYDAVVCLFGAIGHARDEEGLRGTLSSLAAAVRPGGVVIVEPWFEPGVVAHGDVAMHTAESEEVKLCRMSRTAIHDHLSVLEFDYLIATRTATTHHREVHELGLFPARLMESELAAAGLEVSRDAHGFAGGGLWIGRRPAS
jgi:dTDP-3-amino-3,4,6-trideoxy-alpha-D-glucopyranose N,N-dimethyltransferase